MKHIGFLSFGHWSPSPQSGTRSASDALLQSIALVVTAEGRRTPPLDMLRLATDLTYLPSVVTVKTVHIPALKCPGMLQNRR